MGVYIREIFLPSFSKSASTSWVFPSLHQRSCVLMTFSTLCRHSGSFVPPELMIFCVSIKTYRLQFWGQLIMTRSESTPKHSHEGTGVTEITVSPNTHKSHSLIFPPVDFLTQLSRLHEAGSVGTVLISHRNLWISRRLRALHWTPWLLRASFLKIRVSPQPPSFLPITFSLQNLLHPCLLTADHAF